MIQVFWEQHSSSDVDKQIEDESSLPVTVTIWHFCVAFKKAGF